MEIVIFYSWQSDTDFNRKAILDALRQAIIEVEKKIVDLRIKIDEAVSNNVGALHIPNSILQNISKADIVVSDLSIVGKSFTSEKKLSNPNVLIELGYAVSELTWNRIIILFNKHYGEFPKDLPFDIEKRSCLDFTISKQDDSNGIGQLRTELIHRITQIIESNPPKNIKDKSVADIKKRSNDIATLSAILDLFRIKQMDYLFKEGHARIDQDVINGRDEFNDLLRSKRFNLFDGEAKQRVLAFQSNKLNQFPELLIKMYNKKRYGGYENNVIKDRNNQNPKRFDPAKAVIKSIDESYTSLCDYIRHNYHEINMDFFYKYKDEDDELEDVG